jgi:glutaredoxin
MTYTVYTSTNCPQCDMLKTIAATKKWSGLDFVPITESNREHILSLGIRSAPAIVRTVDSTVLNLNSFLMEMDSKKS